MSFMPSWKRSLPASLGAAAAASVIALSSGTARAECLGLGFAPPRDVNICRELLTDIIVPPVYGCGHCHWYMPECCIPGSCLVFPECLAVVVGGYVQHAGDLTCNLTQISADGLLESLAARSFPDWTTLATGGLNSVLYTLGGSAVDYLECAGDGLPGALKDVLRKFLGLASGWGLMYDSIDLDQVRILPEGYPGAAPLLMYGAQGITLGSLVIVRNGHWESLSSWRYTWEDVVWGRPGQASMAALVLIAHELVHVRQYREVGREGFLNYYLPDVLSNGYSQADFEQEAYAVGNWVDAVITNEHLLQVAMLGAGRPW